MNSKRGQSRRDRGCVKTQILVFPKGDKTIPGGEIVDPAPFARVHFSGRSTLGMFSHGLDPQETFIVSIIR